MTSSFLENVKMYLFSQAVSRYCMIYYGNFTQKRISIFRVNYILKFLTLKNLIILLLFHELSFDILEKEKNGGGGGGHQTNYLSGGPKWYVH